MANDLRAEMEKPWAEKAVSWYLTAMLRWLDYGYVFTDEQKEMVEKLRGKNDEDS